MQMMKANQKKDMGVGGREGSPYLSRRNKETTSRQPKSNKCLFTENDDGHGRERGVTSSAKHS